jgi:hypothetical protein
MNKTVFWKPNKKVGSPLKNKPEKKPRGKRSINFKDLLKRLKPGKRGWIAIGILAFIGLLLTVFLIIPGFALMKNVKDLRTDASLLKSALTGRDLIAMESALSKTEADLNALRDTRDRKFGWAARFGPTKEYYSDSDRFINAGLLGIDAARETLELIEPFADAAGLKVSEDQEATQVSLAESIATWVSVMPEVAENMDGVLETLGLIGEELEPIRTEKYPKSIMGYEIRSNLELAQYTFIMMSEYGPDLKEALTVVPGLLGVGSSEKRYMIIMQNDKEIRATGGFWTNYATFKINNAFLSSDFSSHDMYSIDHTLDIIDPYHTFPKVPGAYTNYLKVQRMYARDANISPDYPTAVEQFMYFYNLAMPLNPSQIKPLDGIIAIDTVVIQELLEVTGPVTVGGVTYTSDNVVLELERIASLSLKEQADRKRVLGDLMEQMLVNVFESESNLWSPLIDKAVELSVRKHILYHFFDEQAQELLEKYNLAGRIIDPVEGDYVYAVSTNLGGDKTNWFVTKEIDHTLEQENGRWVRTVSIQYSYPQPEPRYGEFVKRFRDWMRLYVPLGSELIEVTGSEAASTTGEERNKTYFTGYIELAPTEVREMVFRYYLPEDMVIEEIYDLYIQKQPGTNGELHRVIFGEEVESFILETDKKVSRPL